MELTKSSFQDLPIGEGCLFRTDKGIIIHALKLGENRILNIPANQEAFTGCYHEVWRVVG